MINQLSEEHTTPKFHPHVTLLTKLPLSPSLISDVSKTLSTWKKRDHQKESVQAPFELEFENLGTKAKDSNYFQYLFVKIRLSSQLTSLRKLVREELIPEEFRRGDDDYFPHLSLMYGTDSIQDGRIAEEIIEKLENQTGRRKDFEGGQEGEGRKYEVSGGVEKFEVGQVWCVRCEGKVEDWEVLEKIPL